DETDSRQEGRSPKRSRPPVPVAPAEPARQLAAAGRRGDDEEDPRLLVRTQWLCRPPDPLAGRPDQGPEGRGPCPRGPDAPSPDRQHAWLPPAHRRWRSVRPRLHGRE